MDDKAIYPIDKTDLDMLRFTHFLALACLVARYMPRDWKPLTSKLVASAGSLRSALAR